MQRMKEIYPDGVVRLAGYSFGACVAIEMALQLQQQGSGGDVRSLILLDGSHASVTVYSDTMTERLTDLPGMETVTICLFVSNFAFRFANSDAVGHFKTKGQHRCKKR